MEKKRTQAADIAEIASKLDGKVEFSTIVYSQQMLSEKYRETGYYGDIYRNVYIERVKDNPRRNEVTPGVGTQ